MEHLSASEMEDIHSDIFDSEATNLSMDTFSQSVDVSSDVSEVPKNKMMVSTGCGTSSSVQTTSQPLEIDNYTRNNGSVKQTENNVKEKKVVSTSTGTSPPPQSISTQVSYD